MRVLILSDLHLEFGSRFDLPDNVAFDLLILPGDIHNPGTRSVQWAKRLSVKRNRPAVFVPGNHEFYGTVMEDELERMRREAEGSLVHVLSRGSAVVQGVRFLGTTLWTDFAIGIEAPCPTGVSLESCPAKAMGAASRVMGDFRHIRTRVSPTGSAKERPLTPLDTVELHRKDARWLMNELRKAVTCPTVVVTHHAPHHGSVQERHAGSWLTPAFVSELPMSAFQGPVLWAHGHTHAPFDYHVGNCRVICNPRGYPNEAAAEGHHFQNSLVVTVG
jgi:predicted phosphodiesterase